MTSPGKQVTRKTDCRSKTNEYQSDGTHVDPHEMQIGLAAWVSAEQLTVEHWTVCPWSASLSPRYVLRVTQHASLKTAADSHRLTLVATLVFQVFRTIMAL